MDKEIIKTILKKAKGFTKQEVQEVYYVNKLGIEKLVRKKVVKKYYPPNNIALKHYLQIMAGMDISTMTDEELEKERLRLLKELKEKKDK